MPPREYGDLCRAGGIRPFECRPNPGAGANMEGTTPAPKGSSMNRIRAARQALGWTQTELARKACVSTRTIHAVEKGRSCRQATKRHILNALGVPWEMRDEYFGSLLRPVRHSLPRERHIA
jgi:DNA-binding XRE family transcriptional regulator